MRPFATLQVNDYDVNADGARLRGRCAHFCSCASLAPMAAEMLTLLVLRAALNRAVRASEAAELEREGLE